MKQVLVDTNILLRFLTGEPTVQAEKVRKLVERCEQGELVIRILPMVVAEVVFVLSGKYYQFERAELADALIQFLETPSFGVEERDVLIRALQLFAQHKIDYADCYLAANALASGDSLASFDQDFRKIAGLDLLELT